MWKVASLALLLASAGCGEARAMNYAAVGLEDGSSALVAQGRIGIGESARAIAALRQASSVGLSPRTLILSSPGGDMVSAIELGEVVRRLGLRTVVGTIGGAPGGQVRIAPSQCLSACVLVHMGGVTRSVIPGSRVGVHSPLLLLRSGGRTFMLDERNNRRAVQRTEPALRSYARRMGVSSGLIDLAHSVPHTQIRTLSAPELARYGLVNPRPGQRVTRHAGRKPPTLRRSGRAG